jgi:hypothetical protein
MLWVSVRHVLGQAMVGIAREEYLQLYMELMKCCFAQHMHLNRQRHLHIITKVARPLPYSSCGIRESCTIVNQWLLFGLVNWQIPDL